MKSHQYDLWHRNSNRYTNMERRRLRRPQPQNYRQPSMLSAGHMCSEVCAAMEGFPLGMKLLLHVCTQPQTSTGHVPLTLPQDEGGAHPLPQKLHVVNSYWRRGSHIPHRHSHQSVAFASRRTLQWIPFSSCFPLSSQHGAYRPFRGGTWRCLKTSIRVCFVKRAFALFLPLLLVNQALSQTC